MRGCRIFDIHAHIFPEKVAERAVASIGQYYGLSMTDTGTVAGLLASGSRINVHKYLVHSTATKVEQVASINDFIARTIAENDCFIGFGTLHPELEDLDAEVERVISLGLKGIKLHPEFQNFSIDDEEMLPVYKAVEGKFPVLMHMGDEKKTSSSPKRLARVMDLFPNLTVIAAHLGGYRMWDEAMEVLLGRNCYFDTSSSLKFLDGRKAVEIIRRHGVEKVLFGTDYPMWDHEDELRRFYALELTPDEQEMILWKNACKLLDITG